MPLIRDDAKDACLGGIPSDVGHRLADGSSGTRLLCLEALQRRVDLCPEALSKWIGEAPEYLDRAFGSFVGNPNKRYPKSLAARAVEHPV